METQLKTSLRIRAAALVSALATSFVLLDSVALIAHPAGESAREGAQIAVAATGESS
jgi:hypothetical protein